MFLPDRYFHGGGGVWRAPGQSVAERPYHHPVQAAVGQGAAARRVQRERDCPAGGDHRVALVCRHRAQVRERARDLPVQRVGDRVLGHEGRPGVLNLIDALDEVGSLIQAVDADIRHRPQLYGAARRIAPE